MAETRAVDPQEARRVEAEQERLARLTTFDHHSWDDQPALDSVQIYCFRLISGWKYGEMTPLLLPIGGKQRPMSRSAVHMIMREVFRRVADRLRKRGAIFESLADRLALASTHWLRHTAGSHMADRDADLRHVRDNLDHKSFSTTQSN